MITAQLKFLDLNQSFWGFYGSGSEVELLIELAEFEHKSVDVQGVIFVP